MRSLGGTCFCEKALRFSDAADQPGHVTSAASSQSVRTGTAVVDDSFIEEPLPKAPRISPDSSPSAKGIYPPQFAGNVMQIEEVDDEQWELDVFEFLEGDELFQDDFKDSPQDDGNPPVLDPEELAQVDILAGFEENERLLSMKVFREPTPEECEKGVHVSTRSVYDWRYRGQQWRRWCRFVAREFKAGSKNTAETFAPTSGVGCRLILFMHICYGWCLFWISRTHFYLSLNKSAFWCQCPHGGSLRLMQKELTDFEAWNVSYLDSVMAQRVSSTSRPSTWKSWTL